LEGDFGSLFHRTRHATQDLHSGWRSNVGFSEVQPREKVLEKALAVTSLQGRYALSGVLAIVLFFKTSRSNIQGSENHDDSWFPRKRMQMKQLSPQDPKALLQENRNCM